MKKQMERTVYEAPVTERFQVELEGSFCGSADVDNPSSENTNRYGDIQEHEVNTSFDIPFAADEWSTNSGQ